MKFLDQAKIYITSGHGGAGCLSFRREKNIAMGGPDGGNGGRGGDVVFECANAMNTLIDFRYNQHFKADKGGHGKGDNCTGGHGEHCVIRVPVGTQILDEERDTVLYDFTEVGERKVFLAGGDGGFGNARYKSSTNQAPRKTTPGWPGMEMGVWLRLKLIADSGLVGLPNAGKSTFLAACSNAKPKIADYPFTTLHPNLGVVKAGDYDFVLADIPGLIEGASQGQGLGDRFLGHVERTNVLLHLIDCMQEDIVGSYHTIRHELAEYGCELEHKEEIVALNKCDALGEELSKDLADTLSKAIGKPVHTISAVAGQNVDAVLYELGAKIHKIKHQPDSEYEREFNPADD